MSNSPLENEKDKEIEKTSEEEGYEDDQREEVEDAQEGSQQEEDALSEKSLSPYFGHGAGSVSENEDEDDAEALMDFQKRREKWQTLTGRRPRNIPVIKRYMDADADKIILFGERRQLEVEKKIAERMLLAAKKLGHKSRNLGKVLREVWLPALCNGLMSLKFGLGGETMATADGKGETLIRRTNTGDLVSKMSTIEASERLPIRALRYHPVQHNRLYVAGETGIVQIFEQESGNLEGTSESLTTVYSMDINLDGSSMVTGGADGKLHVLDPNVLRVVSKRFFPELSEAISPEVNDQYHRLRVYGIKFHPENENIFVTGACDRTVKIWDVRTPAATKSINGPAVFGDGIDISSNKILTASWQAQNSIALWDFSSGNLIKYVPIKNQYTKFDGEFLYAAQFFKQQLPHSTSATSPSDHLIAVGGGGFTQMLVINIKTDKVTAHFPSYKPIFCLDTFGNLVAYGGRESVYRVGELKETQRE